ncbi:MAG: hypothetical protein A2075_00900 [Geobacteraceae bacterium GWC2_58_44]|nr:MAG: hypothetical protein A2075_00900 [Geobacteraceae bacterium GWC2_58_44]HBG07425.1 hypothetical protein [Geobacter sp.]
MEKTRSLRVNAIPSIAELFFVTIFLLLFFSRRSGLLGDGDTGYHIRAGEYIIATLSIPRYDIFSIHTPAMPWTAHEWLSEVIMAVIHSAFGLTGIVAFFALLLALTTYLLFKILMIYEADILLASAVTILAFSSAQIHWLARPHVFSFLLMIICHFLLESWHRGGANRLYLLPPIMLLWVNLHGGFLGGFILLGAYLLGNLAGMLSAPPATRAAHRQKLKQLALTISACLAVSLINPYGYQILLFPFKLVSDTFIMDHVSEFLSPDFHQRMPFKYLLLLLIAIFALSRKTVEATELVIILIFTNMALYSARYIPLFALITAPILTRQATEARGQMGGRLAQFLEKRSENVARIDARATGYLWPAAALITVAVAIGSGKMQHCFDEKSKPVAATEFLLKERITGNMFNNDEFGDHLIYRSYPYYKVFFDGRSDMYGAGMLKEYRKIVNFEPGWEAILGKYHVTWIFFDSQSNFSRYLLKDSNWVLIYSDQVANIFVKNIPQYKDLIQKYRSVKPAAI